MGWTIVRKWNQDAKPTRSFRLLTKFTDLDSVDGNKSVYGFICTLGQETETDAALPPIFDLKVRFRTSPDLGFSQLGELVNSRQDNLNLKGTFQIRRFLDTPLKVDYIQLEILGFVKGSLFINDFALLYRTHRDSSVSDLDEG